MGYFSSARLFVQNVCPQNVDMKQMTDLIFTSFSRNNSHGQIGDGSRAESVVPKSREDLPPVCQIAAGAAHSMVIDGRYLILRVIRKNINY